MPQSGTTSDSSAIGVIADVKGHATLTHPDGTQVPVEKGMSVQLGDLVETDTQGAVNITFVDHTVFAVSSDAKMTIDQYVFDPDQDGQGRVDISVLRGIFTYTSGDVGHEDPKDVTIDTPVGSIGIRGTTLAGYIPPEGSHDEAKISLIEGAIVFQPTSGGEFFLNLPMETVRVDPVTNTAENMGQLPPEQVLETFNVVRTVAPALFQPAVDAEGQQQGQPAADGQPGAVPGEGDAAPVNQEAAPSDANAPAEGTQPPADAAAPGAPPPVGDVPQPLPTGDLIQLNLMDGVLGPNGLPPVQVALVGVGPMPIGPAPLPPGALPPPPTGTFLPPPPPPPPPGGTTTIFVPGGTTTGNAAPINKTTSFNAFEQAGIQGGVHKFDVSRFFFDPNGDPLNYVVKGINDPNGVITSATFNANKELVFAVNGTLSNPSYTVDIVVAAVDGQAESGHIVFTFNVYNSNPPTAFTNGNDSYTVGTGGAVLNAYDGNDTIFANTGAPNNIIFGGNGDDTLSVASSGNKVFGDDGNDTIVITAGTGNLISGGFGHDNLQVTGGGGAHIYGGAGNDRITGTSTLVAELSAGTSQIDAGSGYDTFVLSSAGSIDLSTIAAVGGLKEIERIVTENGAANTVNLMLSDILTQTGGQFLFIDGDANDTVNVTGPGSANFVQVGTAVNNPLDGADTNTYNVYQTAGATLYISTDTGTVNGV